jgi:2-oxoglutarate dehydrogenase E2 component (dihydrolipoamide succinyltransferase)
VPSAEKPVEAEAPAPQTAAPAAEGTAVKMPALGESVTEGTVTRWLKQVGDPIEFDEPLLEVSTDKVDTEIPSPVAGTVLEIKVPEDETAEVGADLAIIGTPATAPAQQAAPPAPQQAAPPAQEQPLVESDFAPSGESYAYPAPEAETSSGTQRASEPPAPGQGRAPAAETVQANGAGDAGYVTPLVRKLATEKGVDLASLTGTGVGGRIRKQDVIEAADKAAAAKKEAAAKEAAARSAADAKPAPAAAPAKPAPAAAPKPAASPLRGRTEKLTRTRATIARRMVESLQISAQLTTVVEVDITKVATLRGKAKADFQAKNGAKLTYLPFLALAAVEALREHPVVNSSIDQEAGTVTYHDGEHLGIAVDTPKGLIVPVIRDAGDLNLAGLAKRIADVADPYQQDQPGRAVRRHLHADQHRQPGRPVRHPDHQPAAGRHPRHRCGRQARGGRRGRQPGRADRAAVDDLSGAQLRPPDRRRRRRRPFPGHDEGAAGGRALRGRSRIVLITAPRTRGPVGVAGPSFGFEQVQ